MITTQKSYPKGKKTSFDRDVAMYLSIGYQRKTGRRVPKGTKHKLRLIYDIHYIIELYHV